MDRLARIDQVVEWVRPERDGVDYTTGLLSGSSGPALVERAEGAELLVLGRPHHAVSVFASATLNHALKHAPCPVVFVPDRARALVDASAGD